MRVTMKRTGHATLSVLLALILGAQFSQAIAGLLGPSNYFECILDKMPGAQNDPIAASVAQACWREFPNAPPIAPKDKVGGLFSVPHAPDCLMRYAKDVRSNFGAQQIAIACNELYWP